MESRIKEYKKITINDYRNYEPEKCSDGGAYGFWTEYLDKGGDIWEISYGTTADMEFCPCCGSFNSHYDYENEEYSCGDFDTITTKELSKIIKNTPEKDGISNLKSKNLQNSHLFLQPIHNYIIKYIIKQLQIYTILTANHLYANVNIRVNSS